jgi:hypothetical protein
MKFLTTASSVVVVLVMTASSKSVNAADDFIPRRSSSLRLRSEKQKGERELQDFWARELQ